MSDDIQTEGLELHEDIVASIVLDGDLSGLNTGQLIAYYYHRCALLGVDPGEKPFDLLKLNGKLMLYCTKAGTAALTRRNKISVRIIGRDMLDGLCIHTASASTADGRTNDDVGVVDLGNLGGEKLANAIMKSATKAKRRAVLGLCGTGLIDDSEIDSIQGSVERLDIGALMQPSAEQAALPPSEPRCTKKMQPVADAIRERCAALANLDGKTTVPAVMAYVFGKVGVSEFTEPEQLGKTQGLAAKDFITKMLEHKRSQAKPATTDPTSEAAP